MISWPILFSAVGVSVATANSVHTILKARAERQTEERKLTLEEDKGSAQSALTLAQMKAMSNEEVSRFIDLAYEAADEARKAAEAARQERDTAHRALGEMGTRIAALEDQHRADTLLIADLSRENARLTIQQHEDRARIEALEANVRGLMK